jgi:hypothetical protein
MSKRFGNGSTIRDKFRACEPGPRRRPDAAPRSFALAKGDVRFGGAATIQAKQAASLAKRKRIKVTLAPGSPPCPSTTTNRGGGGGGGDGEAP